MYVCSFQIVIKILVTAFTAFQHHNLSFTVPLELDDEHVSSFTSGVQPYGDYLIAAQVLLGEWPI